MENSIYIKETGLNKRRPKHVSSSKVSIVLGVRQTCKSSDVKEKNDTSPLLSSLTKEGEGGEKTPSEHRAVFATLPHYFSKITGGR